MILLGEKIGVGRTADVYAVEGECDKVVKLIHSGSAEKEFQASRIAGELDCGAPRVYDLIRVDEMDGIVMDRVEGPSWMDILAGNPSDAPRMAAGMARLHHWIHGKAPGALRAMYEGECPNALCHGDFHPMNIMGGFENPVVIDWNDAYAGDPASDVCRTLLLFAGFGNAEDIPQARKALQPAVFGLGALYLKEYLRLSGMDAQDVFRWQKILAEDRIQADIPGERMFLRRVAEGGRMFPWDLRIKRKPLHWGRGWRDVKKARVDQKRIELPSFTGTAGLMYLDEVSNPVAFESIVLDTGYRWLHLLPDEGGYVTTAFIDEKGFINHWYTDIIDGYEVDGEGRVCFDDLFLDLILLPGGEVIIDDRDELEAAYALGVIGFAQYEKALAAMERLLAGLHADPKRMSALCEEVLSKFDPTDAI